MGDPEGEGDNEDGEEAEGDDADGVLLTPQPVRSSSVARTTGACGFFTTSPS